jgi:hypothetical protein
MAVTVVTGVTPTYPATRSSESLIQGTHPRPGLLRLDAGALLLRKNARLMLPSTNLATRKFWSIFSAAGIAVLTILRGADDRT